MLEKYPNMRKKQYNVPGREVPDRTERFPAGEHGRKVTCESLLPQAQALLQHGVNLDATTSLRSRPLHNVGWFEYQQEIRVGISECPDCLPNMSRDIWV